MKDVLLMREEEVDLLIVVRERLEHVPLVIIRQEITAMKRHFDNITTSLL